MASQDSEQGSPILVTPITVVPPNPNPREGTSTLNPKGSKTDKNPLPKTPKTPSEYYRNTDRFSHANTPSIVTEAELKRIRSKYHIPDTHAARVPRSGEKMYQRPEGWTAVPVTLLEKGVHFPLHIFIVTILGFLGVGFAQLVPNSYIHILAFVAFCHELGVEPSLDFFFTVYKIVQSREKGFKAISKHSPKSGEEFERSQDLLPRPNHVRRPDPAQ